MGEDGVAGLSQAFIQRVNVKKPLLICNAGAMLGYAHIFVAAESFACLLGH